jgi:hypothetical protein
MAAARLAGNADEVGPGLELLGVQLLDLRQERLVAVAEIFDVLHFEFVGPGIRGFRIHDEALASGVGVPRSSRF